jgi:hypothetical protein
MTTIVRTSLLTRKVCGGSGIGDADGAAMNADKPTEVVKHPGNDIQCVMLRAVAMHTSPAVLSVSACAMGVSPQALVVGGAAFNEAGAKNAANEEASRTGRSEHGIAQEGHGNRPSRIGDLKLFEPITYNLLSRYVTEASNRRAYPQNGRLPHGSGSGGG